MAVEPPASADVPGLTIRLTDGERDLFTLLMDVINHFQCGTTLRVAGGWVRDKIRGEESDDIDVALDNMKGVVSDCWSGCVCLFAVFCRFAFDLPRQRASARVDWF